MNDTRIVPKNTDEYTLVGQNITRRVVGYE